MTRLDDCSRSGTSERGIARFWLEPFGKTSHFNQNSLKYVDQLFNQIYSNKENVIYGFIHLDRNETPDIKNIIKKCFVNTYETQR